MRINEREGGASLQAVVVGLLDSVRVALEVMLRLERCSIRAHNAADYQNCTVFFVPRYQPHGVLARPHGYTSIEGGKVS